MDVVDSLTDQQIYDIQVGLHAIKQCVKCRKWLPVRNFYPTLDGHDPYKRCRHCTDVSRAWDQARPRRLHGTA